MAALVLKPAMSLEQRTVHPFFSKPSRNHVPGSDEEQHVKSTLDTVKVAIAPGAGKASGKKKGPGRPRKTKDAESAVADVAANEIETSAATVTTPKRKKRVTGIVQKKLKEVQTEEDGEKENPDSGSRKRRKKYSSNVLSSDDVITVNTAAPELVAAPPSSPPLGRHKQLHVAASSPRALSQNAVRDVSLAAVDAALIPETSSLPGTPAKRGGSSIDNAIMAHESRASTSRRGSKASSKATTPRKMAVISSRPSTPQDLPTSPAGSAASHKRIGIFPDSSPPKKMLKLNAKGKFSSLVPKQPQTNEVEDIKSGGKRRGRPRKKFANERKHIVVMKYGESDAKSRLEIGAKINAILGPVIQPKQVPPPKAEGPPKPTHPFLIPGGFAKLTQNTKKSGNSVKTSPKAADPKPPKSPPKSPRVRTATATPGKLRAEAIARKQAASFTDFGKSRSATLSSAVTYKYPGSHEASWSIVRVTGEDDIQNGRRVELSDDIPFASRPKRKDAPVALPPAESVVLQFAESLNIALLDSKDISADESSSLPDALRVPERLLTTGTKIQNKVRKKTSVSRVLKRLQRDGESAEEISPDELHFTENIGQSLHPAVRSMFLGISDNLTAFDRGTCETQAWPQKYAPSSAAEVLQSSEEVYKLREWLQGSMVTTVEKRTSEESKANPSSQKEPKKSKKRRKRNEELDDFVVDEDEETERVPTGAFKNVVLLSGPHGSGKTAAIYAVAKELNFEIFEINPGSRRSGKDILERVGDMTANHLVQGGSKPAAMDPDATEDEAAARNAEALRKDLESGRQGTMNAFFKPSGPKQAKAKAKKPAPSKEVVAKPASTAIKPSRQQKQSLILLEEVDILFKEDKEFWTTAVSLATSSKRPIIMTCNDDSLMRIHPDDLFAKLEFLHAPIDLATDYLLLLAAREGHILERNAVSTLYAFKQFDLRATITALNFWCQMAIGDRKGGLEWMYQRWPKGNDVDEKGHTLRVASKDTYQEGMGWFDHDLFFAPEMTEEKRQEEILSQAWRFWGMDVADWDSLENSSMTDLQPRLNSQENLQALKALEQGYDSLSAVDAFCAISLPTRDVLSQRSTEQFALSRLDHNESPLDATLPSLPDKARASYIEGRLLLDAPASTDWTHLSCSLAITTHRLTSSTLLSANSPYHLTQLTQYNLTPAVLTLQAKKAKQRPLDRLDVYTAFEPLSWDDASIPNTSNYFLSSSFDRPLRVVTTDLAPYVRSIVAYDQRLESERIRVSNLLSAGGTAKRQRTTRAARSAQEGGKRNETRRDRYFDKGLGLDYRRVLSTAGESWAGLGSRIRGVDTEDARSIGSMEVGSQVTVET